MKTTINISNRMLRIKEGIIAERSIVIMIFILLTSLAADLSAQNRDSYFKVTVEPTAEMPEWQQLMYSENPVVEEVMQAYDTYFLTHEKVRSSHERNYKFWLRTVLSLVGDDGRIMDPSSREYKEKMMSIHDRRMESRAKSAGGLWNPIGPFVTYKRDGSGEISNRQANVYAIAAAPSNPDIVYCVTEPGVLFKSLDRGLTWNAIALNESFDLWPVGRTSDITVSPWDTDIVYFAMQDQLFKSIDGGDTWDSIYSGSGTIRKIHLRSNSPNVVLMCTETGLYASNNSGDTWFTSRSGPAWDIVEKPGDPNTVYLSVHNAIDKKSEVYKSTAGGGAGTWTLKDSGWYIPAILSEAEDKGCKLGVTPADPDRLYAVLAGSSKAVDEGWIGVYYSLDGGDNWVNPDGQDGGPYVSTQDSLQNWYFAGHYSIMYDQGWYNLDIDVSPTNPDRIYVGTIHPMVSNNRGANLAHMNRPQGGSLGIHSDVQDIDVVGNDIWMATDGGINYSNDEFQTTELRHIGIYAKEYWGFGQGWNEDTFVGGSYHNGNSAYHENYGPGQVMDHWGVEESTGYVDQFDNKECYFSSGYGGNSRSSNSLLEPVVNTPDWSIFPTQSTWELSRSELVHDPRYADHMYLGKDSVLYKSIDGGANFSPLYTFENGSWVYSIEISRENPDVIYLVNRKGENGAIYKSTNGGSTFSPVTELPAANHSRVNISLHPTNDDIIWATSYYGADGEKVYRSANGGVSWIPMSSSVLDGHRPIDIFLHHRSSDMAYVMTDNGMFMYSSFDGLWYDYSSGLPTSPKGLKMIPFHRDGKLRLASKKGIWEAPMAESGYAVAQPMTNKPLIDCANDTVQFDCFSVLNHNGASWNWSISPEPAYISDPTARNPRVRFDQQTSYDVTLTVVDGNGIQSTKTVNGMVTLTSTCPEDFGCTNPYSDNYDPNAVVDDGSCNDFTICDCSGTTHTSGVLTWLGDTYADTTGSGYLWEGQDVNFDCSTWGYDCGDISGAPSDDPYDICGGGAPPSNGCIVGCTDETSCNFNPEAVINDGSCEPEELWYLPIDYSTSSTEPALYSCIPPSGYQVAENQSCVEELATLDPYCVTTDWDQTCEDGYVECIGCSDLFLTAYQSCNSEISASFGIVFNFQGDCIVDSLFHLDYLGNYQSVNVSANSFENGDNMDGFYASPNDSVMIWFSIGDTYSDTLFLQIIDCSECTAFDTAPVDLTKSFDPVNGVQDRVQVKWFKDTPQVKYSDEDAAMCDIKFWKKRDLIPGTTTPTGPAHVNPDTLLIADAKKTFGDNSPREIFKWPIKFRANGANNTKRAEPNFRYEWQVRCECGHDGSGPESPWSAIKIFNTPDFDPATGIYTPLSGVEWDESADVKSGDGQPSGLRLYPNPTDGVLLNVDIDSEQWEIGSLRIRAFDLTGKVVKDEFIQLVKGDNRIRIEFERTLSSGLYILEASQSELLIHERFTVK